jgi:hypothetical protein
MITSPPAATSSTIRERCIFASWMLMTFATVTSHGVC